MSPASTSGALSHLRVIDLSQDLAGAYCTKLLAGFGADVIKIEAPGSGDPMRSQGPFLRDARGPATSIPFLWFHTGKRSVALDLDAPAGVAALRELVATADIVIESLPPGALAAKGLAFESLKAINPGLVLLSISPFGQTGPYRGFQAEEFTLYAMSGLMYSTGHPERAPLAAGPAIAHLSAGMKAYVATLMATLRAHRSGEAEWIDLSIQEAAADNIEIGVAEYLHLGKIHKRSNDEHPLVPWRIFQCRDGHAAIMGGPIRHWLKAAEVFEAPELVGPKYAHMEDRIRHRGDVRQLMSPWLLRTDKRDIFHAGQKRGLAWGYLASLTDVLASPQFMARGFFVSVDAPDGTPLDMVGAPFQMQRTPWRTERAPHLGEHTQQVMNERRAGAERAAPSPDAARSTQPLAGIRVADFTHDWAGPHAARVLADYGAEVIKIEYPQRLDGMRGAYLDRIDAHPRWWQINRNKRSITLDLHRTDHVEACKRLVATCDVVLDNSRPGVMERFGLGYEVVKAVRPDIVYVSMSAHGSTGPWATYAGYGGAIEALSGVQSLTRYEAAGDAMRVREVDVTNGIMGACAVMTGLASRAHSGEGQSIDLSETEASTWLIGEHLLERTANGAQTQPFGNRHTHHAPQGCYRCLGDDRWLALTIRSNPEWHRFCHAVGHAEWIADRRFASAEGRRTHHDEIDRNIDAWAAGQDPRAAMIALQSVGVVAGMVATMRDLAEDPHLQARDWLAHTDAQARHPGTYPGFPFRFLTGGGARFAQPGPDLGQDNRAVLLDRLGLPDAVVPPLDAAHLGTAFDLR